MELDAVTSTLSKVAFFEICDAEQQRLLAFASENQQFRAGDTIYAEGDPADGAYVLTRGSVVITDARKRADRSYGTSGPNVLIGEMALILNHPRSTTVTAVTNVEALFVPRHAFVKLMRQYPDLAQRAAQRIEGELGSYLKAVNRFRTPPKGDSE